jgi:hypothetical protein
MDANFIQFVTETASPHPAAAWSAWLAQQRHIDALHAQLIEMQERVEHLEQRAFEAEQRKLRLIHSAA